MTRHRSFRLTPPDYMRGKRIRPHLEGVGLRVTAGGLVSATTAMLVAAIVFGNPEWGAAWILEWGPSSLVAVFAIGLAVYGVPVHAMLRSTVGDGILTRAEARDFWQQRRWRESWLEDCDDTSRIVDDQE